MSTIAAWPSRAEMWLDERGKGAWIAAMVLGFIFFWPVGLALLAYMIWSKRMFSKGCGWSRHDTHSHMSRGHARRHGFRSSGNTAFDAYKADTLDRLEREQEEFESVPEASARKQGQGGVRRIPERSRTACRTRGRL